MTYSLELEKIEAAIASFKTNLQSYREIYDEMKTEFDKIEEANFSGKTATQIIEINKKMLEKTLKKINELNNFISYLENVKTVYNNMYSGIKEGVNNG